MVLSELRNVFIGYALAIFSFMLNSMVQQWLYIEEKNIRFRHNIISNNTPCPVQETNATNLLILPMQKSSVAENEPASLHNVHGQARKGGWSFLAVYIGTIHDPSLDARWTSQAGQDKTIFNLFIGKKNGYFIDLAANNAVSDSNTLTLEQEYGWKGLCIEANPIYIDLLLKRNCQVVQAVVGKSDNTDMGFFFNGGLGGIVGHNFDNVNKQASQMFKTVSLTNILQYLQVPLIVDYMSFDIEGAEEFVFETFAWNHYTFLVMTIERPKKNLKNSLVVHGYIYVCNHGNFGDELWVHHTFAQLNEIGHRLKKNFSGNYGQQCI